MLGMIRATRAVLAARPTEINLRPSKKYLDVSFNDGEKLQFSAEYLRINCPIPTVSHKFTRQGEDPPPVAGKKFISIADVQAVGNYAIEITFDDHGTAGSKGIYSWDFLYNLGVNKWPIMRKYINALKKWGRLRVPRR